MNIDNIPTQTIIKATEHRSAELNNLAENINKTASSIFAAMVLENENQEQDVEDLARKIMALIKSESENDSASERTQVDALALLSLSAIMCEQLATASTKYCERIVQERAAANTGGAS